MSQDPSANRPITLSAEDVERLVRKIDALEYVLRELVGHLERSCEPINYISVNRMLSALSEEDLIEWLREKTKG